MVVRSTKRDGSALAVAVRVGDHARLVWGSLSGRDFAAIEDLVAELIELDAEGRIEDLDVVANVRSGLHDINVVQSHYMTAVFTSGPGVVVHAIGRPTYASGSTTTEAPTSPRASSESSVRYSSVGRARGRDG